MKFIDESGNALTTKVFTGDNTDASQTTNFNGSVEKGNYDNASMMAVTIPSTAVNEAGEMVVTSTPELVENGIDPNAFIATDTITDKADMAATFNAQVALLKITAPYDALSDVKISGKGICGVKGNTDNDVITLGDITAGKTYYIAVWPGEYSDGITITSGDEIIKDIFSATLKAGKYYTVTLRSNVELTMDDIRESLSNIYSIYFDYTDKADLSGWTELKSLKDGEVKIYSTTYERLIVSNKNICMTGSLTEWYYTYKVNISKALFAGNENLNAVHFSNFHTSKMTDMSYMFYGCRVMSGIDHVSFNTSNVTNMECMFANCENLRSLDLSSFNTSNVENMTSMFNYCGLLGTLTYSSHFVVPENHSNMFASCVSLENCDLYTQYGND